MSFMQLPIRFVSIRDFALRAFALPSVLLWSVACGDEVTGPPPPPPNQAPVSSSAIPAQTVTVGQVATVDVSRHFRDPDGDALSFTAVTSDAGVASVSVAGSIASVSAVARGEATVTVTARDPSGLSAQLEFVVTVPNQPPSVVDSVPSHSLFVGDSVSVDVARNFTDADGDSLTYDEVSSSNAGVVTASLFGSIVTVSAVSQGDATVSVSARDTEGLSAELSFPVVVPNRAPVVVQAVSARSVFVGSSTSIDVAPHFADPDGDELEYFGATTSNVDVATVSILGSVVEIVAVSQGNATVSVGARDAGGMSAEVTFSVNVPNRAPVISDQIAAQSLTYGNESKIRIDVATKFSDPDDDELDYSVASSDLNVVNVSISGSIVTITESERLGEAVVTVMAQDPHGLSAMTEFPVSVVSRYPNVGGTYTGTFTVFVANVGERTGTMSMTVIQDDSEITIAISSVYNGITTLVPAYTTSILTTGVVAGAVYNGIIRSHFGCSVETTILFSGNTVRYNESEDNIFTRCPVIDLNSILYRQ